MGSHRRTAKFGNAGYAVLAGSISKLVAAFGALHLVQEGKLSLDADVNTELRTWKVPENEFTKDNKIPLRRILSYSGLICSWISAIP